VAKTLRREIEQRHQGRHDHAPGEDQLRRVEPIGWTTRCRSRRQPHRRASGQHHADRFRPQTTIV
jgi:hypothetical protein